MIVILAHPNDMLGLGSIVGVEKNERFIVDPILLEQVDEATDEDIELMHEIPARAGLGGACELGAGSTGAWAIWVESTAKNGWSGWFFRCVVMNARILS